MVCLDTDFVIELIRREKSALSKLDDIVDENICITVITLAELYKGAYLSSDIEAEIQKIKKMMGIVELLLLEDKAAKIFGDLFAQLRSNRIDDADLLIASVVIAENQKLLTRNLKHFERVPGLTVDTW